ncbi:MAG TPA: helix-turn-helix domain-containing protein [Actinobacteria bacterium]|nr:helix-turn-helix domain-containing protein [Actinomycetota bacterium]
MTFNRRFLQRGSAPPGVTFGMVAPAPEIEWCGQAIDGTHLLRFSPETGYESVSGAGFRGDTISYPEPFLHDLAETLGLSHMARQLSACPWAFHTDGLILSSLRNRLRLLYAEVRQRPQVLASAGVARELAFDIPSAILRALAAGTPESRPTARARSLGLRRALALAEEHPTQALTVGDLCRASGVSWRTLNYAFREKFGVTAERYLKVLRLDGVRREMRWAGPNETISDIANRWGFWHMGQFAADYRTHFGELPSATRRRPKPNVALAETS